MIRLNVSHAQNSPPNPIWTKFPIPLARLCGFHMGKLFFVLMH